jgi:hypothetical protein
MQAKFLFCFYRRPYVTKALDVNNLKVYVMSPAEED